MTKQRNATARVLVASGGELVRETARLGVPRERAEAFADKASSYVIRLDGVGARGALAVRQHFSEAGGKAMFSEEILAPGAGPSAVLMTGSSSEVRAACERLAAAGFGREAGEIEKALSNFSQARKRSMPCGRFSLTIGERTLITGILNLTPDSFSGDGLGSDLEAAVETAERMEREGADIIDIGGESTRPGTEPVAAEEEMRRVLPAVEKLAAALQVPISIDTYKAQVARAACEAGAGIVNDVTAFGGDPAMAETVGSLGVPVILMHMQGTPETMQVKPAYADLMGEIFSFLRDRAEEAQGAGVSPERIIIDPGIGFGKTLEHNLEILRRLKELRSLGYPILVGTSRKSLIGKVLDLPVDQRLEGTAATVAISIQNGADIVRVHDVREMARVVRMTDAIVRSVSA
jgi:dihydropteroate synthase